MSNGIKKGMASIPILGPILRKVYMHMVGRRLLRFERSDQYWEDRYRMGKTSGSGSYGRLAQFKADFLNDFVKKNGISTVVEFGCGDGAQLELFNFLNYIGFDVSKTAINVCTQKFTDNPSYEFHLVGSELYNNLQPVDLALSLDVIFHLVEGEVFDRYMWKLFSSSKQYVVIYAYDFERSYSAPHERGRNFTRWVEENAPNWGLTEKVPNRYPYDATDSDNTSQSEFFVYEYRIKV